MLRAAQAISAFAHKLGIQLIAASGNVRLQAQDDNIELGAAKQLHGYALKSILLEAPEISLKVPGAQITLTGNDVLVSSSGTFKVQAASFDFSGDAGGELHLPGMPQSSMKTDERVRVTEQGSTEPIAGVPYQAFSKQDGRLLGSGTTDADGYTEILQGTSIENIRVVLQHPAHPGAKPSGDDTA